MKPRVLITVLAGLLLLPFSPLVCAEVKVVVDHNDTDHCSAEFKFEHVPVPAKSNAAIAAKFSIVDGEQDGEGGDLDVIHDGKLPDAEDEPTSNFVFRSGSEGGRIAIDFGHAIDIKQINTYSWHPNTRAPQVYEIYGSDGSSADFNAAPAKNVDPNKCGWKLITKIDTRPKTGEPGGQYGVSISDPDNGTVGKYRYLLLVISRTESDDAFGNTFYSEITVIDSDAK